MRVTMRLTESGSLGVGWGDDDAGTATTVAGGNRGLQDGPTHTAKFSWPYGVALSPNSNTLYVADSGNDCIRAIALDAGTHPTHRTHPTTPPDSSAHHNLQTHVTLNTHQHPPTPT